MIPIQIQLRLHPKEKFFPSDSNFYLIDIYPIYYKIGSYAYNGTRYKSVIYEIYYQENGAIGLNSISTYNSNLGYHNKDIERIIVLHDNNNDLPMYVFFSAHAQEGKWYKFRECEYTDKELIVYASLNSHSNRPHAGIAWRVFGFANDYTSEKGKHLTLTPIKDDTISYNAQNLEVIDTAMKSFLLPLYQKSIPKLKAKQAKKESDNNKGV